MAQGMFLSQQMKLMQVLAPQLQQSLHLLQAPTLELKALVEQELEQNPLLEEVPIMELQRGSKETDDGSVPAAADLAEPPADVTFDPATERETGPVDDFQAEFDRLSRLDQEWREHFSQLNVPSRQNDEEKEKRQFMFDSLSTVISLQEHLLEQVRMSDLTEAQRSVAEMIIGNIDDRGYLQSKVDELAFATNVPAEQIAEVLKVVQTFYPPGVGARDLRECLLLQLERAGRKESLEYRVVNEHLEALGRRRLPEIAKALDTTIRNVQDAAERISHLEPCPGREFLPDTHQYVVPELFVEKVGNDYVVSSNNDYVPHLRISNTYKDLMAQTDSSNEVREYIREKIRAGKNIIKSLHQRQQTLLNIAREIVRRQSDFMEFGVSHLRPMTMLEVAEVVGVHETTVSRAVSGKYIQTPQGVFEMKYFFTSGIQTANGADISNMSIKDILADMVRCEDTSNPLSDEQIVKLLEEKGIKIARRTVAKYRSELKILPSTLRKVY
jgi:RNA polymerase sigma-54 factor